MKILHFELLLERKLVPVGCWFGRRCGPLNARSPRRHHAGRTFELGRDTGPRRYSEIVLICAETCRFVILALVSLRGAFGRLSFAVHVNCCVRFGTLSVEPRLAGQSEAFMRGVSWLPNMIVRRIALLSGIIQTTAAWA